MKTNETTTKKMYLSKDKKLSGVCGGMGEYFDVDPTVMRLAWILFTVLTGFVPGIVAYVVAAIVIPTKSGSPA